MNPAGRTAARWLSLLGQTQATAGQQTARNPHSKMEPGHHVLYEGRHMDAYISSFAGCVLEQPLNA